MLTFSNQRLIEHQINFFSDRFDLINQEWIDDLTELMKKLLL